MDIVLAISSFILGGILGVLITAIAVVGGRADAHYEREDNDVIHNSDDNNDDTVSR